MSYQIAIGYNQAASLADVDPQPSSPGVQATRRYMALDGHAYNDGADTAAWVFTALSESEYSSLLTAFGLTSAVSAEVTVKTTKHDRSEANYNAIIIRPPRLRFEYGAYRNVEFRLTAMEAL